MLDSIVNNGLGFLLFSATITGVVASATERDRGGDGGVGGEVGNDNKRNERE